MKKLAVLCVFGLVLASSCKKDAANDTITTQTIHGQVYNLCTDSGLVNCTVFLNINNSASGGSTLQTVSGTNGMFSFANVQIHSSSDYSYDLEVKYIYPSGSQPAIVGIDLELNKSNIVPQYILGVVPNFHDWYLCFPAGTITTNDTFTVTLQQNIFHKNAPQNPSYQLIYPCPSNAIANLGNFPMGWWHTTLNKTHNGMHTITTDSFYVGWGATVTDTIPW
jgi:hypothetical protein